VSRQNGFDHRGIGLGEEGAGQRNEPVAETPRVVERPVTPRGDQVRVVPGRHIGAGQDRPAGAECQQRPGVEIIAGKNRHLPRHAAHERDSRIVDTANRVLEPGNVRYPSEPPSGLPVRYGTL